MCWNAIFTVHMARSRFSRWRLAAHFHSPTRTPAGGWMLSLDSTTIETDFITHSWEGLLVEIRLDMKMVEIFIYTLVVGQPLQSIQLEKTEKTFARVVIWY
jgi:hypothetical protein